MWPKSDKEGQVGSSSSRSVRRLEESGVEKKKKKEWNIQEWGGFTNAEEEVESYLANFVIRKRVPEPGRTQRAHYAASEAAALAATVAIILLLS